MKTCPACAEEVKAPAQICRYCGYSFVAGGRFPADAAPHTNAMALASLVLGILWLYGIGSILAVIFGLKARKEIDGSNRTQTGRGMATAGIVLGWIGFVGTVAVTAFVLWVFSADNWGWS